MSYERTIEDFGLEENRIFNAAIEAERCLLGSFLLNHELIEKATLRGFNRLIFSRSEHAHIAAAMVSMANAGKPVDVITCFQWLTDSGTANEVGGLPYINTILQSVPSASNWARYLEIVIDKSRRRIAVEQLQAIMDKAHTDIDFDDWVTQADSVISGLNSKSQVRTPIAAEQAAFEAFGRIDDVMQGKYKPLFCGIQQLDDKIGGFERGQLVTIGARSSHGKSALALEMMVGLSGKYACAMLQLEMSNRDMGYRLIARLSGVGMDFLKNPKRMTVDQQDRIGHIISNMNAGRVTMMLHDQPALSIEQIASYAKQCKKSDVGLDVLVIDHLHLTKDVSGKKQRRDQELERVTAGLKELAKNLNILVILCAQLGKNVEGRPKVKDLRECASIEQDSDVVILTYLPRKDIENYEHQNLMKVDVAKNRNGETGWIPLTFEGSTQKISDWHGSFNFDETPRQKKYAKQGKEF